MPHQCGRRPLQPHLFHRLVVAQGHESWMPLDAICRPVPISDLGDQAGLRSAGAANVAARDRGERRLVALDLAEPLDQLAHDEAILPSCHFDRWCVITLGA